MSQIVKLLRFYLVLLVVFTAGRWAMSLAGVPYEKGHHVFSLVTLSVIASAHHAAFARRLLGWRFGRVLGLGLGIGLATQLVIFISTAVSYLAGLESYFNHPTALNAQQAVPFGAAMLARVGGLVVNCVINMIAAALGWLMGGALPAREEVM